MEIRDAHFQKNNANGTATVEWILREKVIDYINNGGSLHITRKQLPFYEEMHSLVRKIKRKTGQTITNKQALESVGIFGYSDIYFSYLPIFDLYKFKDTNGNVDSYRKDGIYAGQYAQFSKSLNMPESLVIQLVGNENLETSILHTDLVSYIRKSLQNHLDMKGSLKNLKRINNPLYELMRTVKNNLPTPDGAPMSMGRFVSLLDFPDSTHNFSYETKDALNIDEIISKYVHKLDKDFKFNLNIKDINKNDYLALQEHAQRTNTTIEELFNSYALNYTGGIKVKHLQHLAVKKYPYIDEMRKLRDWAYADFKKENPDLVEEDLFENYLFICKDVYERFKDRIKSFNTDPNYSTEKLLKKLEKLYAQNQPN